MDSITLSTELAFYARHGAALFPIPAGSKAPHGLVPSFKHDHSSDPEQWKQWASEHENCNFGVVAFASQWIICDIDTSGGEAGRAEAWQVWSDLCVSWGLPGALSPHCQSQSGGWHCYLAVPAGVDASQLRQPDAVKGRINLRCVGYTVAAGSTFEGRPYLLFPDAPPPHPAPDALIKHCSRAERTTTSRPGTLDKGDVAELLRWLAEHDAFTAYEDWVAAGMAAKIEFGDDGESLWALCHDSTVAPDIAAAKWASFATEPTSQSVTLNTWLKRAHAAGWKGTIRKSTASMFDGVAQLAAATGATSRGMPMTDTDAVIADLGHPILESFLTATPTLPATNVPTLPDAAAHRPLFEILNLAIARVIGVAETTPKAFRAASIVDMLAVLSAVHPPAFTETCNRIRASGAALPENKVNAAVARFESQVFRAARTSAGWKTDSKGKPESSNTDNVTVGLRILGAEMRYNEWANREEILWSGSEWVPMQDRDFNQIVVTFGNGQHNFHPPETLLKRTLNSLARESKFDPVKDRLAAMQAAWDGVSRLDEWLHKALGVPCDALHAAIGRNLLGGICKRVRRPGCKHDEVVILMGPEDTLKSTFCRALAMDDAWFTDSVDFSGSPQNTIPQLFGRVVVELAELDGMEKREVHSIKRFLSAQSDNVTLKYEAYTSDHARRCVFIGTTNESNPLRGDTGNRRFLPVHIEKRIDMDWVRANLEQLMGEAATLEAAGELFLIPEDVIPAMRARQESVRAQADFEIYLDGWFSGEHAGWMTAQDLGTLVKDAVGRSVASNQYGRVMKRLGFESKQERREGRVERIWRRGTGARWALSRDPNGRLMPKQMFAALPLPPLPY